MSLLAATSRTALPGPSTTLRSASRGPITQVRTAASGIRKVANSDKKYPGSRLHGAGKPTRHRFLKPMSANDLTASVFQPDRRQEKLDLPAFSAHTIELGTETGVAVSFPVEKHSPVWSYGLPKSIKKEFSILSKPYCLVRDITLDTCKILDNAQDKSSTETRMVITGDQGTGKSYLLMQAVQYAQQKGWIVIYVPKAEKLVNSTSSYAYDIRTRTYVQPGASFALLKRMLDVNFAHLSNISLKTPFKSDKGEVPAETSLADFIGKVLKDGAHGPCPSVLEKVWEELEGADIPILLAIDGMQALYGKSRYRNQHYELISTYHLSVPRALMEFANGTRKFKRGAVLGAVSNTSTDFPIPLELRDALEMEYPHPVSDAERRRSNIVEYTKGLQNIRVPSQLSLKEASEIFEVWMKERVAVVANKDEFFLSKLSEAQGNARDFVWKGLLNHIQY